MWPWDHAAVAYLLVSATSRAAWHRPPTRPMGVLAVGAALLPDLIDKPLSWGLGLLPAGRSLGHSLFTALLLVAVAVAIGVALDRRRAAAAFAIGYFSHLAGDVAYPLFVDGELRLGFLLWPLVPVDSAGSGGGLPYLVDLVDDFLVVLTSSGGLLYVAIDAILLGGAATLWFLDRRALREATDDGTA